MCLLPFGRNIILIGAICMNKMNEITLPHDHGHHNEEKIWKHLPAEAEISGVSEAMRQLGDPSRLRIFWLLCHCEECVVNIAAIVSMSSPAVSHHLRILKSSGLIVSRREGKEMYYKTADTDLAQMLHHMIEKLGRITCPEDEEAETGNTADHTKEKNTALDGCEAVIRKIHDRLTEDPGKRYTIDELAREYLINTAALKTTFKAVYGMPVASYMKQYRMKEAAKMLQETDQSIADIARSVGYESQSKFSAAFKDIMKTLPTDYRRQCRK